MAKYITKYRGLEIMDKGARALLKKLPFTTKIESNKLFLVDEGGNKLDTGVDLPAAQAVDLKDYAKKSEIPTVPTKVSELTNDSNFLTAVPQEYITEDELTEKQYITSADITGKVDAVEGKGLSTNDYDNTEKQKVKTAYDKVNAFGSFTVYDDVTQEETTLALDQNITE